ncbi:HPP family protein [Affinibrenneria salicis]|uniref:HPP family protein n=1 Tax=Affinibrenneria salicis TaxID=2590031 RepID=A0A5J5FYJ9_9GAMM|nr:HPP family protein [Affinibrenneria salicis]KAA8999300.1 HPP family protein [Affinibrenneria salicis]
MFRSRYLQSAAPSAPTPRFIALSFLGTVAAIGLTGWLSHISGAPWLMAPFGASCVLAFGLPDSPLAQPRAIIGGHLIATAVGLLAGALFGDSWLVCALATGLALAAMQLARCVHAPAGADPLVVIVAHSSVSFLVSPVLLGSLVVVLLAWGINNLQRRGSYPRYWW